MTTGLAPLFRVSASLFSRLRILTGGQQERDD